jgi:PIN domain nuclease of toxin-antitoxin system
VGGPVRLLLDTHVVLWLLGDPTRIAERALDAARNPANDLVVSAVTSFEIATKHRLGKLPMADSVVVAYDDHLTRLGVRELPMTGHHGLVAGQLRWSHRDPFDRLLAAQSITDGLVLVTSDAVFDALAGVRTLWA